MKAQITFFRLLTLLRIATTHFVLEYSLFLIELIGKTVYNQHGICTQIEQSLDISQTANFYWLPNCIYFYLGEETRKKEY